MQAVGNVPALPWISFFYLIVAFFQQFSVEKPRPFFLILPVVQTFIIRKSDRHVRRIINVPVRKHLSLFERVHRAAVYVFLLFRLIKSCEKQCQKCHIKVQREAGSLTITVPQTAANPAVGLLISGKLLFR